MKFAVVGQTFLLPDKENFTKNIKKGIDSKTYNGKNGNMVHSFYTMSIDEYFSSTFFGYSEKEADLMDVQHKGLIYLSWKALNNYGFLNKKPLLKKTGVFTSITTPDKLYQNHTTTKLKYADYINNLPDTASSKISYKFNLGGPSININSACSSSFSALKTAQIYLKNKDIDMALVGSAKSSNITEKGYKHIDGSIFSKKGECKPFDKDSDGTVPGIGQFVFLIKRLDDALIDKDNISAILYETNLNNDGDEKVSYTAPSFHGQVDVMKEFYSKNSIKTADIDYVETHGTATQIGDALEISSLNEIFNKKIYIGSSKANYGHLDTASGFLSLYKAIDMLDKQYIPPIANFNTKSSLLPNNIKVPKSVKKEKLNKIAINSFGVGGTNGHLVVEKYIPKSINTDIKTEKVNFPVFSHISENLVNYANYIKTKLQSINFEEKLKLLRTLLFDQEQTAHVLYFQYNFRDNSIKSIDRDKYKPDSYFLNFPKTYLNNENIEGINNKRKKQNDNDVLGIIQTYMELPKEKLENLNIKDLDLDSFILIEMVDEINEVIDKQIPFDYFINFKGTIKDLITNIIEFNNSNLEENIHLMDDLDLNKSNIILFHPAGGIVSPYNEIMKKFSNYNIILVSFPQYLLKFNDLTMESLAKIYIKQLEKHQLLDNNITLGGYSLGGNIAYEIAKIIDSNRISQLLLIDSHPIEAYVTNHTISDEDYNKVISLISKEFPELNTIRNSNNMLHDIWKFNHSILKSYDYKNIEFLDIKVTLFRCMETENQEILDILKIKNTDKTKWEKVFSDLNIIDIPGNHYSIFSNSSLMKRLGELIYLSI